MTDLPISKELAQKLEAMAQSQQRTVEELLAGFVEKQVSPAANAHTVAADTLLSLAEIAEQVNLHSQQGDISSRFDEYVDQAITEHFQERQKDV